jgi:glutamate-1-semialdehyde 2,1-aminomutase
MNLTKSQALLKKAKSIIPGGVNSPVRAYSAVGGSPPFIEKGYGPYLEDVDGNRYIDYVLSWGPLILGHAHPEILRAVNETIEKGTSFGAPTEREIRLAQKIVDLIPSIEMVRLVNSGTEATMSAIRLARAYTKRDKIIKFVGCYHGHADPFLIEAGSGSLTLTMPSSPGIPAGVVQDTLIAEFNELDSVEVLFEKYPESIAAVIIEPVAGNMGCVPPVKGFLEGLRELTQTNGSLLIFDEVMTGFRVYPGGAQEKFGITPDLTTLGKVIGGGFPIGAYGGKKEIMSLIAPEGKVYQAGTLSGNPVAVAAGLKTLELISVEGYYDKLFQWTEELATGIRDIADQMGLPIQINREGSMFSFYFSEKPIRSFSDVMQSDKDRYLHLFHKLLERGIYLPPSPYESLFTSSRHDQKCLERTLEAIESSIGETFLERK